MQLIALAICLLALWTHCSQDPSLDASIACSLGMGCGIVLLLAMARNLWIGWLSRLLPEHPSTGNESRLLPARRIVDGFHLLVWSASSLYLIFVVQWPDVVRYGMGGIGWVLLDEVLILSPIVGVLLFSWRWMYRADGKVGDVQVWRTYILLLIPLLPVSLACACSDITRLHIRGGMTLASWTQAAGVVGLAIGGVGSWMFAANNRGASIRFTKPTQQLNHIRRKTGVRFLGVLRFSLQTKLIYIGTIGIPGLRLLVISDGLASLLSDAEMSALIRHEAAHIRRGHTSIRLLAVAAPLLAALACVRLFPHTVSGLSEALRECGIPVVFQTNILAPVVLSAAAVLTLGWCARGLEFDADWWSCENLNGGCSADLSGALRSLQIATNNSGGWIHPPLDRRIASLNRDAGSQGFERMGDAFPVLLRWSLFCIVVLAVGACFVSL